MTTYSALVNASALGAGADDTFTAVGTITMRPKPGRIIGAWVNDAPNAGTAAQSHIPQYRFNFGELGLKELRCTGAHTLGEQVATNCTGNAGAARLIPLAIPFQGNEKIDITAGWHTCGTPTAGVNAQAGLLYVQGEEPPVQWWRSFPGLVGASGSDAESNAAVTADATAITDLQIPAIAKHVIGFGCSATQDAAPRTAEDLVLGIDFSTSTFPDFSPQEYPFVHKVPNLGTGAGSGISPPYVSWPAWIPTHSVSGQITPESIINTTMTDNHSVAVDVYYTVY